MVMRQSRQVKAALAFYGGQQIAAKPEPQEITLNAAIGDVMAAQKR
jgi:hypothetical protein